MSDEEIIDYHGAKAPRYQECAFCNTEYDALLGPIRPHGVCEDCWPEICAAERQHAAENPITAERHDYVLEWSQSQACFHIETIDQATERNLRAFHENRKSDWIILLENLTHHECHEAAEKLEQSDTMGGKAFRTKLERMLKL